MTRESLESEIEKTLATLLTSYSLSSMSWMQDEAVVKAKAAILSQVERYLEERELLARVDEMEKSKRLIGDLNMERIGVLDVDSQTSVREDERRFWHSTLENRLKALRQQVKGGEE